MELYYGTTSTSAARIRKVGLRRDRWPEEIWFSRSLPVAQARARQLSRSQGGRPIVVVCRVDLGRSRRRWGPGAVCCRGPMVALRGRVEPCDVVDTLAVDARWRGDRPEPVLTPGEVLQLLDSPSPRVRLMGVMMLSAQDSTDALDWLCTRLDDPDPRVRLAVAMVMRRWGRGVDEILRGMGDDRDPMVREAARGEIEPVAASLA